MKKKTKQKRVRRKYKYSNAIPINLSRFAPEPYFYDIWRDFRDRYRGQIEDQKKRDPIARLRSHEKSYLECLKCVIANLVYSVLEGKNLAIGFRQNFYVNESKRNPLDISRIHIKTVLGYLLVHDRKSKNFLGEQYRSKFRDVGIDLLQYEKRGYLDLETGYCQVSEFSPTDRFKTLMEQWQKKFGGGSNKRVRELCLTRIKGKAENSNLVRRKRKFDKNNHEYWKVDYKHPLVKDTRKLLMKYNTLMRSFKIKWDVVTLDPPALYRLFIVNPHKPDMLEWHGRFYAEGGHYQNFKEEFCKQLTIDGSPVTELDFSSTHPTLAYDLKGLTRPTGDAYDFELLKPIDATKQEMTARDAGKALVNIAINASNKIEAIDAFKGELALAKIKYSKLGVGAFPRLIEGIGAKHEAISEHFLSGNGNWFMFIDSEICRNVLADFVAAGIPILPKHDSFIVRRGDDAEFLKASMERHWVNVVSRISNNPNFTQIPNIKPKY